MTRVAGALAGVAVLAVIGNAALKAWRSPDRMNAKQPVHLLASTTSSTVRQQGEAVGGPESLNAAPVMAASSPAAPVSAAPAGASPQSAKAAPVAAASNAMKLEVPTG